MWTKVFIYLFSNKEIIETMKLSFLFLFVAILLIIPLKPLSGQVAIAPSTVFISDQTNIGTLYVSNRSDDPQEVNISFSFGYPTSDADGNLIMTYDDSLAYKKYALNEHIRVFPRSFVLGPREQQTVRLQVRPMPNADDGVYWTKVRVLANPQQAEIDMPTEDEAIATRISFRFDQILAAFYKKGNVTTGVDVTDIEVRYEDERILLLPHLTRLGNSPFIGSISAKLYNSNNELVTQSQATTTAYFQEIRRISLNTADVPPGDYRAELTFETRRSDMSPADLVQAAPVTEVVNVRIP